MREATIAIDWSPAVTGLQWRVIHATHLRGIIIDQLPCRFRVHRLLQPAVPTPPLLLFHLLLFPFYQIILQQIWNSYCIDVGFLLSCPNWMQSALCTEYRLMSFFCEWDWGAMERRRPWRVCGHNGSRGGDLANEAEESQWDVGLSRRWWPWLPHKELLHNPCHLLAASPICLPTWILCKFIHVEPWLNHEVSCPELMYLFQILEDARE